MKYLVVSLVFFTLLLQPRLTLSNQEQEKTTAEREKVSVEDVIPLTAGNMRGHKMLYNEGWYIVSSSRRALEFAKEKSIVSSKTALRQALDEASKDTTRYREAIKADVNNSAALGKNAVTKGTELTGDILSKTHSLAKDELAYAGDNYKKAMDSFVRGNLSIVRRTEKDRRELANLPGNYYKSLKNDFSNIFELTESARKRIAGRLAPEWEKAFQKAGNEFRAEYEKSGNEHNSLMALGPILHGYLKSFYYGLAAPASKTIVVAGVAGTSYMVFLPVSATAVVTGRTIQSVGLTVYYVGKAGVNIVSPTVEGGLLSGLSLLSLGSVPVTYVAGGTWGVMNQVAFSTVGPAAGAVEAVATTSVHSAGYVGFLTYDAVKGTTKVVINQASSGIVLGYNALTAVPMQALFGVEDAAVFLFWDGPRLGVAMARGRVKLSGGSAPGEAPLPSVAPDRAEAHKTGMDSDPGENNSLGDFPANTLFQVPGQSPAHPETYSLGDLPVGTVVDLKKLGSTEGVSVQIISTDEAVIKEVLEKIPDDARVTNDKGN